MKEYNELTKKLLSEGYTIYNHPEYVKLTFGTINEEYDKKMFDLNGGFSYQRRYEDEFVYKTGCGKHVMGKRVLHDMGYMGVDWSHENDNPVVRCPYDKGKCELNDTRLHGTQGGGLCIQCWCVCHRTDNPYEYENSIEKADEEREEERKRKYQEFSDLHHGRVCINQTYYNERTREWNQIYEPDDCYHHCSSTYCPIRQRKLDNKKGNVFYDLKTSIIRQDGTLFDGEEIASITKGMRFFNHPVSMDICKDFIKLQSDKIYKHYWDNHGSTTHMFNKTFKAEVLNIRAESRPSRDLMQDLEDIKAGVSIVHESDSIKKQKEAKKQAKEKHFEDRLKKTEQKIAKVGFDNLEYQEVRFLEKNLSSDEIEEMRELYYKTIQKEAEKPVQMELLDYLKEM